MNINRIYKITKLVKFLRIRIYCSEKSFIVLLVDSDGSGKAAKNEANILAKKLSGFSGIEKIDVINSGGTGSMSGGAIFGIIFAVMVALGK